MGTRTPVLASDGADLAAAVQSILEMGGASTLAEAIADAFDGATLAVEVSGAYFALTMRQPGLLRALAMDEVSDGTLRYLLLATALLSPRPPALMILNEPETSLHTDLLPPLARLISRAALRSQIVVVSHARRLVDALAASDAVRTITLVKTLGETRVEETAGELSGPPWTWPTR